MQGTPQQQQKIKRAHTDVAQQRYQRAHSLAMEILHEDPTVAEAYFIMALIAHKHDNVAKAEDIVIFVVLLSCVSFHCNSIKLSIKNASKSREYNKLIDC